MERTTLEIIAPTVEEAVARGLEQLGVSSDKVVVDILDEGSKGFLGFGARQVRVRLTLKPSEIAPAVEATSSTLVASSPVAEHLLEFAAQTTRDLLSRMKINARVSTRYGEADLEGEVPLLVDIRGEDLSILIGRRAETLNALQYILALIISKEADKWVQVVVDVEGYRARRERQLRQLARRIAEQAIRTGKRQVLEPMSSAERRIIHLELRDHPAVTSESIGEEPNRKVTIVPKK
ncbi:MAG: protein jag [Anaerolineae bacterium]|nr:MAG: protein jag [Anaerolineae bacterium]